MVEDVILRFDEVTFEYIEKKPLLEEVSFSLRKGAKFTLMGQNGAGKSTLFGLIKKELKPKKGQIFITGDNIKIGAAEQTVARDDFKLTVEEYFSKVFEIVPTEIKTMVARNMDAVNLDVPTDRIVGELSGGQKARLLLATALIQKPDILLLDEPTNNLDKDGIGHLIEFLIMYDKTVIVISHDADFLNCFTEGVLYLDAFSKKIESYQGDYYSVVEEIKARVDREKKKNAQLEKKIQDRKDKANFFSHKGGKMRKLAKKMKDETEEMENNKTTVRRDDRTIRDFTIPRQDIYGDLVIIDSVTVMKAGEPTEVKVEKVLKKNSRLIIEGPNGIGKTTLLKRLVENESEGAKIMDGLRVGYYSQDFTTLNYDHTVIESLEEVVAEGIDHQKMRTIAAGFLITGNLMGHKVSHLSEGQKGLLSFARLVLMEPGILILDEPSNHINFRHIPVIAKAVNEFEGAIILISHMEEFVEQIQVEDYLYLGKLAGITE